MDCPKCDKRMEHQEADPDTGIVGGFYCDGCDVFIHDSEVDDDPGWEF